MKQRIPLAIVLSLMLVALDWLSTSTGKHIKALAADAKTNNCVHLGRLISVQGKVQLKRKGWSDYHLTAAGAELCVGDLLRPARGTRAIVQCASPNQNPWTVPSGVPSGPAEGCRSPKEPIHTITKPINSTRNSLASGIPHIISPKKTWLLNDKPKLRWMAVPGATSYVVRVSSLEVDWITEVKTTSVVYPGKPPLKPGEGYLLMIEADNGETAKTIFGLLDQKKAALVRTAASRIARQNLDLEAETLALAELYIGQQLIAEATELLEALANKGSKTPAIHQMLGDLYAQLQLFRQAESNYLQAVDLATTAKDIEAQAVAAARLGEVYAASGNSDAAAFWIKQSQKGYQVLSPLH